MSDLHELLGIPDFRRLWLAQVISNFGDSLGLFSLLFLAQRLTGNPAHVAGVLIAITLPTLVVGLAAGVWVDRRDRKAVMIGSDIARALVVPLFLIVREPGQVWMLYAIAFLLASAGTFFMPAKSAIVPQVVGANRLLAANSVSESSRVIFSVLGTAAAGVLVGLFDGFAVAFVADAVTFLISAMIVARMTVTGRRADGRGPPSRSSSWAELMAGLGVIRRSRFLLGTLVSAAITMFGLGAVNALLVPFVVGDLGLSEAWFGLLEASQSTSMILAGGIVAVVAAKLRPTSLIPPCLAALGLVVAALAGITTVAQLAVLLFVLGWFMTPLQASFATIVQTETPPELLGRTGAALNAALSGSNVASMAIAGAAAAAVGARFVFVVGGVVIVLSALAAAMLFRPVPLTRIPHGEAQ